MSKIEVKGKKKSFVIDGNEKSADVKSGGTIVGYIKQIVTNKYEVKNRSSKIGLLYILGSKISLQNTSGRDISKMDYKGTLFKDDLLKAVVTTYFE